MSSESQDHHFHRCPAPEYCEALAAYGFKATNGSECFFEIKEGPGQIITHIDYSENVQYGELAKAIVHDAEVRLLCGFEEGTEKAAQVEYLTELHLAVFERYLDLWKSMIQAAREGRSFTDAELAYFERLISDAQQQYDDAASGASGEVEKRALGAYDRCLMKRHRLLFDDALISDINTIVGNIVNERPTLIVGDKGLAKTEVAKFVMHLYGTSPKVISVKGDMMSDELIGKMKHDRVNDTFVFEEGILLNAMRRGEPILLDEINFGDQAIIARLQEMLLSRAGESVYVQENGEESVEIAAGFAVLATANEASVRYRHREVLDPAIRDRFIIVARNYPDLDSDIFGTDPETLRRLAFASAVDDRGIMSRHIDEAFLDSFVRITYITEFLYATSAKDAQIEFTEDLIKSVVKEDSQPLLTDCITPRVMSNTVTDCAKGNIPGKRLDARLLDDLLHSLDQAGSRYNYDLMRHVAHVLGIDFITS